MMHKHIQSGDVAGLVVGTQFPTPIESRVPSNRPSWVLITNVTAWIFEVQSEDGNVRAISWPGALPVTLRVITDKLYLVPTGQLTGTNRIPAAAQAVYVDVTDSEPPAASLAPFFTS